MTQPTNAELDRFLAEEVMGWCDNGMGMWVDKKGRPRMYIYKKYVKYDEGAPIWHPSADIAQVMECAEKLAKDNVWRVEIDIVPHGFAVNVKEKTYSEKSISSKFGNVLAFTICLALYESKKGGE